MYRMIFVLVLLMSGCAGLTDIPTPVPVYPTATVQVLPAVPESPALEGGEVYTPTPVRLQVCRCSALHIRDLPGGGVVGWLDAGEVVSVIAVSGDWAQIVSGGWVHRGYLCLPDK